MGLKEKLKEVNFKKHINTKLYRKLIHAVKISGSHKYKLSGKMALSEFQEIYAMWNDLYEEAMRVGEIKEKIEKIESYFKRNYEYFERNSKYFNFFIDTNAENKPLTPAKKLSRGVVKNMVCPTSLVANDIYEFFMEVLESKERVLAVDRNQKQLVTYRLDIDGKYTQYLDGKKLSKPLTRTDKLILDSICSLYEARSSGGRELTFNALQVYQVMTGKRDADHADPATLQQIVDSIMRTSMVVIYLDATAQAKWKGFEDGKIIYFENLLYIKGDIAVNKVGNCDVQFTLIKEPVLLDYCKHSRQITTYPIQARVTSGKTAVPYETLKNQLMQLIYQAKHAQKRDFTLTYNKIYEWGIYAKPQQARDKTHEFLDHLTKEKEIRGYDVILEGQDKTHKGKGYHSVKIKL